MPDAVPDPEHSPEQPEHREDLNTDGPSLSKVEASEMQLLLNFASLAGLDPFALEDEKTNIYRPANMPYLEILEAYIPRRPDTAPEAMVVPQIKHASFDPDGQGVWILMTGFNNQASMDRFVCPMPDVLKSPRPQLREIFPIQTPNAEFFHTAVGIAAHITPDAKILKLALLSSSQALDEALANASANARSIAEKRGSTPQLFVNELEYPSIISTLLVLSAFQAIEQNKEQLEAQFSHSGPPSEMVLGITRHSLPDSTNHFEIGLALISAGASEPGRPIASFDAREQISRVHISIEPHGIPQATIEETDYQPLKF